MSVRLPIDDALDAICAAVRDHPLVAVVAPPGAGKTTRVPPALLDSLGRDVGAVWVLQPRQMAARVTARRIAAERGSEVGAEVGYSVRHDKRSGPHTRVEVMTEGVFTRRVQRDPFLEGVSCVVIDEFHERSMEADLALALTLDVQRQVRDELKIVLMSATLDVQQVTAAFPNAPVIDVPGRAYPVEILWRPAQGEDQSRHAAHIALEAMRDAPAKREGVGGDVLVFLPGRREIRRCAEALSSAHAEVVELHGGLSPRAQDAALGPSARQRIILATNVAETSLTLPEVTAVVDSGLARRPSDAGERLRTVRISQASAEQRTGRAGRIKSGVAYRLWSEHEHRGMRPFDPPAILRDDLSRLLLEVASWGGDLERLQWFDPPPRPHVERAWTKLVELQAFDARGITSFGQRMASLPLAPRLAAVALKGEELGALSTALDVVACADESLWPRSGDAGGEGELRAALRDLRQARASSKTPPTRALGRALKTRAQLARQLKEQNARSVPDDDAVLTALLLAGFSDRVARRHQGGSSAKLADGSGVALIANSSAQRHDWFIAVEIGGSGRAGAKTVFAAHPLNPDELPCVPERQLYFDPETETVRAFRVRRYGSLLVESQQDTPSSEEAGPVLAESVFRSPARALGLGESARRLVTRIQWLSHHAPELSLPDLGWMIEDAQRPRDLERAETTLQSWCAGLRGWQALRRLNHVKLLAECLTWSQRTALEQQAPDRFQLPCGASASVRYEADGVTLSAKAQHFFGLTSSPSFAFGRVTARCELLAPNGRPAQVTSDLSGFWETTWLDVRKALRGRYPKHPWPERPRLEDARKGRRKGSPSG